MRVSVTVSWGLCRAILCIILVFCLNACATPREAYVGSVKSFSDAADSLAAVTNPTLEKWRTSQRALIARSALTNKILNPKWDLNSQLIEGKFQILCQPRIQFAKLQATQTYVAATGKAMGNVAAEPPDTLEKLLEALGTNYAIKLDLPTDYGAIESSCRTDLDRYFSQRLPPDAG